MKRAIAGPLWFLASLFAYELVWSLTGVPRAFGPLTALGASAFVVADPLQWFWRPREAAGTSPDPSGAGEHLAPAFSD